MSQNLWTRSKNEDHPNGPSDYTQPRGVIPPNVGGKRYALAEVFDVWNSNKDNILNGPEVPKSTRSNNENYRLEKPVQIFHVDLQKPRGDTSNSVVDSNAQLDSNLTNETQQNQMPAQNINQGPYVQPSLGKHIPPYLSNQGMSSALIPPEQIEWYYMDPSGNEQGPFTGNLMQEWLSDGYLQLDLRIRRKEQHNFQFLRDFCESVKNYSTPFHVPLPDCNAHPQLVSNHNSQIDLSQQMPPIQNHSAFGSNSGVSTPVQQFQQSSGYPFLSQPMNQPSMSLGAAGMRLGSSNSLFNSIDTFSPSFGIESLNLGHQPSLHQSLLQSQIQHQQSPSLSRTNSGWMELSGSTNSTNIPSIGSGILGQQLHQNVVQPTPMSPWLSGLSQSRVSSPFIENQVVQEVEGLGGLPVAEIPVSENLKNFENLNLRGKEPEPAMNEQVSSTEKTDSLQHHNIPNQNESQTLFENSTNDTPITAPTVPTAPVVPETDTSTKSTVKSTEETQVNSIQVSTSDKNNNESEKAPTESPKNSGESQPKVATDNNKSDKKIKTLTTSISDITPAKTEEPKKPVLAPWASQTSISTKPKVTLKEIQALEAEQLKKEKQAQAEANENAAKLAAKAWKDEQDAFSISAQPALPKTSGWASMSTSVSVTKSLADIQREEENAAKARMASQSSTLKNNSSSFASAVANSVPKEEVGWTTVPKKTVAAKKPQSRPLTPTLSSAKVDPQTLRNVSAQQPVTVNNSTGMREDFLVWARSQMSNLYPSVSKDDLLDIIVSLPNGPDSISLISETIYSSSATMDGRRFAKEFINRRNKLEKEIGPCDDWQAVILSSADKALVVDEDGWTTGKKKKGRR